VTIRLDFSLYPRAPKAAHCTAQSLPLLTMDFPQVVFNPRDLYDGLRRERLGVDDLWDSLHSPPQLTDLADFWQSYAAHGKAPEEWSSVVAGRRCEDVNLATDMASIAHTGEHVPLFERVYRLPEIYAPAHVVEQVEPSPLVAAASPKGASAAEQVRTCASSVLCFPKHSCTCTWEWLSEDLPEVTPDGDHAQHCMNDDESEATTSTTKFAGTSTWELLADDLTDDLPEVTTKVNSTNKRKRGSDQGEESLKGTRRMRLWR
jgi:hypothetical protein